MVYCLHSSSRGLSSDYFTLLLKTFLLLLVTQSQILPELTELQIIQTLPIFLHHFLQPASLEPSYLVFFFSNAQTCLCPQLFTLGLHSAQSRFPPILTCLTAWRIAEYGGDTFRIVFLSLYLKYCILQSFFPYIFHYPPLFSS